MRVRTGYSFNVAIGHLPKVLDRLEEIGAEVAPICDRASTFGFRRWRDLCNKRGLRPVFGVELAVVASLGEKQPTIDYWQFFALDDLKPLHDLVWKATANPGREPVLTYRQALAAEGVIAIAGERVLLEEIESPHERFFVSLSPATSRGLFRKVRDRGLPFIKSMDNRYVLPEDRELWRCTIQRGAHTQSYPQHILSDAEWEDSLLWATEGAGEAEIRAARANLASCLSLSTASLRKATLVRPARPASLRELCEAGAARLGVDLEDEVYAARLERELSLIAEKDFEDYFYIIADIVTWAKERMIVGPARGSSCGSLVCYLLGITAIDPIPYNLIFERFIDVNRMDIPDIDIDFSDTQRHLVFQYIEDNYGRDRVARLGTVGMFQPKSALNTIGAAIHVPKWMTSAIGDAMPTLSTGDSRYGHALEDSLTAHPTGKKAINEYPCLAFAMEIENHPHNHSQHAAGVVVTEEPISNYMAVDARSGATHCDKKDAEALDLLKIDALGLTQLSIFERALTLAGLPPVSDTLERLPVDDPEAFAILNQRKFAGVFQFTGTSLQSLSKLIQFDTIEDIIAITALARPGPLSTGGSMDWVRRRNGEPIPEAIHPRLHELTEATYGVVMYQETVMMIVREIGGFSWGDTAEIRRLMSKTMGEERFQSFWAKFRDGAVERGMQEERAKELWDQINTFGSWAFNRSHAVAYGMVSYWCCWMKAHYPLEFAAATLDATADPLKQIFLLRELEAEGVGYVPVDPAISTDRWAVDRENNRLVGPLLSVHGIGPSVASEILTARQRGEPIRPALAKRLESAKTPIDSLYPIRDRVKELHPNIAESLNIVSTPKPIIEVQEGETRGDFLIFAVATRISLKNENDEKAVQRRGGRVLPGPDKALHMFVRDDTDEIFTKVERADFERMGAAVLERGREGNAIYAIKGWCPRGFRMVKIQRIKYIGDLVLDPRPEEESENEN